MSASKNQQHNYKILKQRVVASGTGNSGETAG